jgi:hypothetical protein
MTNDDLFRGVAKAWLYAKHLGVEELFACPTSLKASDTFKDAALNSSAHYEEVYLTGLRGSEYNILLADYAFLQFSLDEGEVRYAYYPNPFLGSSREAIQELHLLREMVDEGAIDYDEYLHAVSEVRFSQHPPLVRYENAPSQYKRLKHPSSHIHFGHHGDNRWPVSRVLTPQAFSLIVYKHFYGEFWSAADAMKIHDKELSVDDIYSESKSDCRVLPDDLFSTEEARQFHFG